MERANCAVVLGDERRARPRAAVVDAWRLARLAPPIDRGSPSGAGTADASTGATAKGAGGDAFSDEKLEALFRSMEAKFKAEMGLVDAEGEGEAAEGGY